MLLTILIVLLILGAIGGAPQWGYHDFGYGPSGIVGIILIIFLIMYLTGHRF